MRSAEVDLDVGFKHQSLLLACVGYKLIYGRNTVVCDVCELQVIIIYEPTVGSFLSKGILRMIGTVSAILVALACSEMTEISGRAEVYLIPVFLFMGSWLLGFIRQVRFDIITSVFSSYK